MPPNFANSQQALAHLQQQQSSQAKPQDLLAANQQKFGVNAAQENVTGLRGAINNTTKLLKQVAPGVMGRTANSLVSNAQANRIIQNEQAPIAQNLDEQGRNLGLASADLEQASRQAKDVTDLEYGDQTSRLSYLQNLYNALYQRERDAEADRVAEIQRQEEIRRFNEQLALSRAAAARADRSGGGGSTFNLTGGSSNAPTIQDQAYRSVQQFLSQGSKAAESDYRATLKSAQRGNALDKLKIQLYNQQGIGKGTGGILMRL